MLLLIGCVRHEILKPEYLNFDISKDITVVLIDGRKIELKAGDYRVTSTSGIDSLHGTGRIVRGSGGESGLTFQGSLSFSDIREIITHAQTATGAIVSTGGIYLLVYGILFIIALATITAQLKHF